MKTIRKFAHFDWGCLSLEFGDGFNAYGAGLRFFGEDNTLSLALHWHYSLYLGVEIKWLDRIVKNYEHGWRVGAYFAGKFLTVDFFNPGDRSSIFWGWWEFLTGPSKYSEQTLSMGSCEVILPENRYQANYEVKRRSWHFPRWFVTKQADSITVNVEGRGIPIPGKGENSWDCGDDAIRSVTTSTDWDNDKMNIRLALEDLAMTVLKRRQRYASLDWLPRDEADEIIEENIKAHNRGENPAAGVTDQMLGKA